MINFGIYFIQNINIQITSGTAVLLVHQDIYSIIHEIWNIMMTSSNGNIFRVTGHLCGEFTGPRWIPHTMASDAELWWFLWSASESTIDRGAGDLRRNRAHYDVIVMYCFAFFVVVTLPWLRWFMWYIYPCIQGMLTVTIAVWGPQWEFMCYAYPYHNSISEVISHSFTWTGKKHNSDNNTSRGRFVEFFAGLLYAKMPVRPFTIL